MAVFVALLSNEKALLLESDNVPNMDMANVDVENGSNMAVMFNVGEKTILATERGTNVVPNVDVDKGSNRAAPRATEARGNPRKPPDGRHRRVFFARLVFLLCFATMVGPCAAWTEKTRDTADSITGATLRRRTRSA